MESNPSPIPSPHNNETNNNNNNRGVGIGIVQIQTSSQVIPSPRSDSTTFVQADTSNFKQVVQMLTGSSETTAKQQQGIGSSSSPSTQLDHHHQRNFPIPPIKTFPSKRPQQGIINSSNSNRLYERRNLMINTLLPGFNNTNSHRLVSGFSPKGGGGGAEILSPSMLNFPRLNLSPVTPLTKEDPFNRASPSLGSSTSNEEEDRAIADKGFYLHPSPRDGGGPPQLLPLFPLTSPTASQSTSSSRVFIGRDY